MSELAQDIAAFVAIGAFCVGLFFWFDALAGVLS
jgi:hypothetical protein